MTDRVANPNLELDQPSAWKPWAIASVAATIILAVALGLMNMLGLFAIPADDQGAKTIAAALALVGSVLASVVTLVGTVVKYSIDTRNAWFTAVESHRSHALGIETEHRNRIDAAIRAVDLLGENNKNATPHQIGGAILALVSLGELELAVALLADLWPSGLASSSVADYVLTNALKSPKDAVNIAAATTLFQNAERIPEEETNIWPVAVNGWNADLPINARTALAIAAAKWMHVELKGDRDRLPTALVVLYKALEDPSDSVRDIAAGGLRPLTEVFPPDRVAYDETGRISIEDLIIRLRNLPSKPSTYYGKMAAQFVQEALPKTAGEK